MLLARRHSPPDLGPPTSPRPGVRWACSPLREAAEAEAEQRHHPLRPCQVQSRTTRSASPVPDEAGGTSPSPISGGETSIPSAEWVVLSAALPASVACPAESAAASGATMAQEVECTWDRTTRSSGNGSDPTRIPSQVVGGGGEVTATCPRSELLPARGSIRSDLRCVPFLSLSSLVSLSRNPRHSLFSHLTSRGEDVALVPSYSAQKKGSAAAETDAFPHSTARGSVERPTRRRYRRPSQLSNRNRKRDGGSQRWRCWRRRS